MFLGYYRSKITKKNQITFPNKFAQQTGKKILLTQWFENSLMVVPENLGKSFISTLLSEVPSLVSEVRDMERFFYANAVEVELDAQNRFILPEHLKKFANVNSSAVFVGVGERIEIWDEKLWVNYGKIREMQIATTARRLYTETIQKKT